MKKIAQATITILAVLFISIGSTTVAQVTQNGGQGGSDTGGPPCSPTKTCRPTPSSSDATNSASNTVPQVGTWVPNGQMTDSVFFDLLLLFIQLRLGL
jgi:hypothetical protein